ncbi:MAG: tetratricopeptide repeat protein [Cytophagales bacterium]|nr:MAG: tetratricopeptide repeat protein [Cytophagales bacterium]
MRLACFLLFLVSINGLSQSFNDSMVIPSALESGQAKSAAQSFNDPLSHYAAKLRNNRNLEPNELHSRRRLVQLEREPLRPSRRRGPNRTIVEVRDSTEMRLINLLERSFHYLSDQNYEQAVAALEQAAQLNPKEHFHAARTYLRALHDYPRALHHLNAYDALTPDFDDSDGLFPVSYLKGLCYRNMGNHAEAVRQFSIGIDSLALKHGSEWVNYKQYVSRAVSYLALQQPDKALDDLVIAAKNCPNFSPLVTYYKAKAFEQQGRPDEAKRTYQDALFFWQANRVKGIGQPEDQYNPVFEDDIDNASKQ